MNSLDGGIKDMNTIEEILEGTKNKMHRALEEAHKDMSKIRTGRANPLLLDSITVEYYGTKTPLNQLANISAQDGQVLIINPYDKSVTGEIEKAILKSDLDITPNNDGNAIRIIFPPLTTERRKEMVKLVKKVGEEKKVVIRNIRRDITDTIKKFAKEESISEDDVRKKQDHLQKMTDKYITQIEEAINNKEKEILEV